jgi:hypothetical protein
LKPLSPPDQTKADWQRELNDFGNQGWELVAVIESHQIAIFKRAKRIRQQRANDAAR